MFIIAWRASNEVKNQCFRMLIFYVCHLLPTTKWTRPVAGVSPCARKYVTSGGSDMF